MRMTTVCGAALALLCLLGVRPQAQGAPDYDTAKRDYDRTLDKFTVGAKYRF